MTMIEARMDKGEPERIAFRVLALRQAIIDSLSTETSEHMRIILENALRVDSDRAHVGLPA
jgi:hypothetical protein